MTRAALATAALCILGPWTLGVGPIPLSLCSFLIYLLPYVMPWYWAVASAFVYLALGTMGLPVFSAFGGGLHKLLGPTGGYLVGYLFLAAIGGLFVEAFPRKRLAQAMGMLLGTGALYAIGTAWFCFQTGQTLASALLVCVTPFLPGDCLKIWAALLTGPLLRRRIR